MPEELNLDKDSAIDPDALDVEWVNQPSLFRKYAIAETEARKLADTLKERIEVVYAEEDSGARAAMIARGEKPTEASVKAAVLLTGRYQQALREYLEAQNQRDMYAVAVRTMDQKKSALENLVRLHGQQYFAGPTVPRNISEEVRRSMENHAVDVMRQQTAASARRRRG